MGVGATNGHLTDAIGQDDLVGVGAKLDFASEKRFQLPSLSRLMMQNPYAARYQPSARQLSADADDGRQPELDLMAVQVTLYAQVFQSDGRNPSDIDFRGNAFVDDSTVALAFPQRVLERLRGCHDIIEGADLSK